MYTESNTDVAEQQADADAWMDELTDENGNVLVINDVAWLDYVFGDTDDATAEPRQPTRHSPTGALALWRAELKAGVRTVGTADALIHAACKEATGLDAKRDGLLVIASDHFRRADYVIEDAAAEKAKQKAKRDSTKNGDVRGSA